MCLFRLLKWFVFVVIAVGIWYLVSFYMNMSDDDRKKLKKDTIEAIDNGDVDRVTAPLKEKIDRDLQEKKADFFDKMKARVKGLIYDE